jgi:hypothetical protein
MRKDAIDAFVAAVHSKEPVRGLTHSFYRYPGRFSPLFARAAIEAFSKPGDVVLDPFMGGGTTLVEAAALGRHSVGADISSLAVFLTRVKTTALSEGDLRRVADWARSLPPYLNLRQPPVRAVEWYRAGYQRNLPWPIRKTIEFALARLDKLPRRRQQRFARCLLLKAGQWALDCRERIPSVEEFRLQLFEFLDGLMDGMRQYSRAVRANAPRGQSTALSVSIHTPAADLPERDALARLPKKATLVVTSPPYPGVHVLYHRWNVRGRKESPAPFWIADCRDGEGAAHYTLGDRRHRNLLRYFQGIRDSFGGVRKVVGRNALVVQMVAFSEPDWQIPTFMDAMAEAGFEEDMSQALGIPMHSRLWRAVPGRRWFALIQGQLATSKEVVLFHRPV